MNLRLNSLLTPPSDFGPKKITVDCMVPGEIKTDVYIEAARLYVPNEKSMSDERVDQVSFALPFE